ncbi:biotin synthase BioB, partial [Planctomycetaceae bacterium AH-315-I19]|nr:biotin synthase BioB [Planctomycetaceae bacterium AH-315-I19]
MTTTTNRSGLSEQFERIIERGIAGEPFPLGDAAGLLCGDMPLLPLLHACGEIRRSRFGNRVQVHVLNNVQNGACPEDCGYCGQAKTSDAPIAPYTLKSREEIIEEAAQAKASGAFRYCMVLSGRGPSDEDIEHMAGCIREVKTRFGLDTCLSSGLLDAPKAQRLREAGLDRLNHNLNTSRSRYPDICTTHTYQDRIDTLHAARGAGLQLCTGLIVGMDESADDLVELAHELSTLGAESIPVNFLVPIPGNRVREPHSCGKALTPGLCLRALCLFRLMNPKSEVRVAAGREHHLRSMQALALEPANSLFVDGYLLTQGDGPVGTLRMIVDAGYDIDLHGAEWPERLREAVER